MGSRNVEAETRLMFTFGSGSCVSAPSIQAQTATDVVRSPLSSNMLERWKIAHEYKRQARHRQA